MVVTDVVVTPVLGLGVDVMGPVTGPRLRSQSPQEVGVTVLGTVPRPRLPQVPDEVVEPDVTPPIVVSLRLKLTWPSHQLGLVSSEHRRVRK